MRPIVKFELIKFLKLQSSLIALVGDRIYSKFADADKTMPAITVVKSGESRDYDHSGDIAIVRSSISITVFAESDFAVEEIKDVVIELLHGESIQLGDGRASIELIDDSDVIEDSLVEMNISAGNLEFTINWEA